MAFSSEAAINDGLARINTTKRQHTIEEFAKELVSGSYQAYILPAHDYVRRWFETHPGQHLSDEQLNQLHADAGLTTDLWGIGPRGAVEKMDGRSEVLSLGEFIGGVAVANGIHPEQSDIENAIFFIGQEMLKLGYS